MGILTYLTIIGTSFSFAINYISKFLIELEVEHWIAIKSDLKYDKSTICFGLLYGESVAFLLISSPSFAVMSKELNPGAMRLAYLQFKIFIVMYKAINPRVMALACLEFKIILLCFPKKDW